MHYLKAVQAAGTDNGNTVMARMKAMPINDFMTHNGKFAKTDESSATCTSSRQKLEESKGEWDLLKVVATIPGMKPSDPFRRAIVLC
jgi:branched-chain amino acid transport system substrate-binding protein